MDKDIKQNSIKNKVLEKIKKGDIKFLPKSFFILKSFLFILAIIIVFSFLLLVTSFIFFALQESELWYLPMFGLRGVELLLGNFPWLLILLVLFFIGILEVLVDHYSFVYRKPLLYSALAVILIVVVMGFFVRQTSLHEKIYGEIKKGGMPPVKSLYDKYTKPNSEDFHPGTVARVKNSGFVLELRDKTTIDVMISKNTQIRPNFEIYEGGRLLIIGKIKNGVIEAEAIDNAPPGGRP
jgi:hypothetical protein